MRRIKLLFGLLLAGFAVMILSTRCEKVSFKEDVIDTTTVDTVVISFSADIKPIFSKCTSCHGGAQNPNLKTDPYNALVPAYVTPADSINPAGSIFLNWLETDGGHKPRTTTAEKSLIFGWIKQGAKNN